MGIKKDICKMVGESIFAKDLYEYKKNIKEDIEQIYIDEIKALREALCKKQKQIDELIMIVKEDNKKPVDNANATQDTIVKENNLTKNRLENKTENKHQQKEESRFPFYSNNRKENWVANPVNQTR